MAGMESGNNRSAHMRYPKENNMRRSERIAPVSAGRPRYVTSPAHNRGRFTPETVRPLDPSRARERVRSKKKRRGFDALEQSSVRDFMLGFVIGLAVFGLAAVIICSALFSMFS